ncbi:hypothetical protein D3C87_516080 [compost metagenome]
MKKAVLFGFVAVLGASSLVSCKKEYACSFADGKDAIVYEKLSKFQAENEKPNCEAAGGTWSKK